MPRKDKNRPLDKKALLIGHINIREIMNNRKVLCYDIAKSLLRFVLLCFFLTPALFSIAEIRIELRDPFKNPHIAVGEDYFYVWDDPFDGVFVYSRKSFYRVGRFSQQ